MNYQSIVQKDNELWINGKKIEQPKSLFLKNCVSQVKGRRVIMKDKLLQIINHYGINNQLKYIHSEYYELDEAIINYWNDETYYEEIEKGDKEHIAEEIADVMVMLKQFQYYYGISDEQIEDIMKYKIDRQIKRIEEKK